MNMQVNLTTELNAARNSIADYQRQIQAMDKFPNLRQTPGSRGHAERMIQKFNEQIQQIEAQMTSIGETEILGQKYEYTSYRGVANILKHFVYINGTKYHIEFPVDPDLNRTRGNKAKIYDAYILDWNRKNPEAIVVPNIVHHHEQESDALRFAMRGAVEIDKRGLCLKPHRFPTVRMQLKDGRVVEQSCDDRGLPLYAIFPSLQHANNYKQPQSHKEYFNEW